MEAPTIRHAREDDIPAIGAIYRHAVETTTGNFELAPPDDAEMLRRYNAVRGDGAPYVAAEIDGRLAGYAYAAPFRPRPAYRFTVEDSIYVADWAHRRGIGAALLTNLIEACTAAGARQMIAVIGDSPSNPGSIALHRRFGFAEAGRLHAVGWKRGGWRDTLQMQRALGDGGTCPPV